MRFDRAAAGLTFGGVLVALAFAPGGAAWMTDAFLGIAGLVAIVAFAPLLPVLNRLPRIGAPRISTYLSTEPVAGVPNHVVMRVGFVNAGPRRVEGVLMNVLVPDSIDIRASDHNGQHVERGSVMPTTVLDGRPARFWAEKDGVLAVGSTLLHYRLAARVPGIYPVRVTFSSDDLYGQADRVVDDSIEIEPRD